MYIPRAVSRRAQLDQAIEKIKETLGPEVLRLRYKLGEDWTGDAAIFFHIVIADEATRRERLNANTHKIEDAINGQLEPLMEWGVLPYYSYRSQSEFAERQELEWV